MRDDGLKYIAETRYFGHDISRTKFSPWPDSRKEIPDIQSSPTLYLELLVIGLKFGCLRIVDSHHPAIYI